MLVYTSCTNNYLPKARVLAKSLKKYNPDWEFCLVLGESEPECFNINNEPFDRILHFNELEIQNYNSWLFRHSVVEICTAAKGPALRHFLVNEGKKNVIYLDPDICVYGSLKQLEEWLKTYDILLTPHILEPQKCNPPIDELSTLMHGVYNLGFLAVTNSAVGINFANWWEERLYSYCYDDKSQGLFTDQKWIDLVPAIFDGVKIIRDPGYDVATWNLYERRLYVNDENDFFVRNREFPLRFYHFTGYDSKAGYRQARKYISEMPVLVDLWQSYEKKLIENENDKYSKMKWQYSRYSNGEEIPCEARIAYRNSPELQKEFPNPFDSAVSNSFYEWTQRNLINDRSSRKGLSDKLRIYKEKICNKYKSEGFMAVVKSAIRRIIA